MKSFLEEYGFAILAAIVVILLIAMCTPIGSLVKQQISNIINKFGSTANNKVDRKQMEANLVTTGALYIAKASETDQFEYQVVRKEAGVEIKDSFLPYTDGINVLNALSIDENSNVYVILKNVGTGELFITNSIKYNASLIGGGTSGGSTLSAQEYADASALVTGTIAKGEIIKIDNKDYLVMKVNGTEVMVLAKYTASSQKFHDSSNAYFTSAIDTYLTGTFQTSLNSAVQNALVEQTITQNQYSYNPSVYHAVNHPSFADMSTKTAVTSGTRKVFLLDVADIEEYLGSTYSKTDVQNMFAPSGWYWLRSAVAGDSNSAFYVLGGGGDLEDYGVNIADAVRPAFVIDLSKI